VLAVEFGDFPRAYSVLAYSQSAKPESPWHADQATMFANGTLKKTKPESEKRAVSATPSLPLPSRDGDPKSR
jgi:acyl-homoserine lactone acylase PvdQ